MESSSTTLTAEEINYGSTPGRRAIPLFEVFEVAP